MIKLTIAIPVDTIRQPFDIKGMELVGKISFCQIDKSLILLMWLTKVKGSVVTGWRTSQHLHNVNFSTGRPLSIELFIRRHHPESRKISIALWNLKSRFEDSILEIMLTHGIDTAGGIGNISILIYFLNRHDGQLTIFDLNIFRRVYILLLFLVYPARLMQLNVPVLTVQFVAVKVFLPLQGITLLGKRLGWFLRFCFRYHHILILCYAKNVYPR